MKLLAIADMKGIESSKIETLLEEENIPDYDLDNLKIRLGLESQIESPRKRKNVQSEINWVFRLL